MHVAIIINILKRKRSPFHNFFPFLLLSFASVSKKTNEQEHNNGCNNTNNKKYYVDFILCTLNIKEIIDENMLLLHEIMSTMYKVADFAQKINRTT